MSSNLFAPMELVPLGTMTAILRKPYPLPKTPVGDRSVLRTHDDRCRWLNRVQAVANGALDGLVLTYEVCFVR